ncbi:hypothetical protein OZX65_02985 [Leuconostocaceae bacterium ESL0723]|nr:hypothetical protein OZX65_02985 [Leuconostocaceae bacterium ESL0723]
MKIINDIKGIFAEFKELGELSRQFKAQLNELQAQLPDDNRNISDLKISIDKFNFKNRPHLERISQAQESMRAVLGKSQADQ